MAAMATRPSATAIGTFSNTSARTQPKRNSISMLRILGRFAAAPASPARTPAMQ
jgi:hypothetical protein